MAMRKSPQAAKAVTKEAVGARLQALRKREGFTLKQLSQVSGVPLSTLSKMELGQASLNYDKLLAIAVALGIDMSLLMQAPDQYHPMDTLSGRAVKVSSVDHQEYASENYRHKFLSNEVGGKVMFADLPGYGFAKVPDHVQERWKDVIEGYLADRDALRMVVMLVDARREPQPMDGQLLYALTEAQVPALVVATKVDKLSRNERQKSLSALLREFLLAPEQLVAFSSVTREGRDVVWDRIEAACRPGAR